MNATTDLEQRLLGTTIRSQGKLEESKHEQEQIQDEEAVPVTQTPRKRLQYLANLAAGYQLVAWNVEMNTVLYNKEIKSKRCYAFYV